MAAPPPADCYSPYPASHETHRRPCLSAPLPPLQGDTLGRLQRDGLPCPHRTPGQTEPHLKTHGPLDELTLVSSLPLWDRQSFPLMEGSESAPLSPLRGRFLPVTSNRWAGTASSQYPQDDGTSPPGQTVSCLCVCCGSMHLLSKCRLGGRQGDSRVPAHSTPRSPTPRHPAGRQRNVRQWSSTFPPGRVS